jgi:hypothetical protein
MPEGMATTLVAGDAVARIGPDAPKPPGLAGHPKSEPVNPAMSVVDRSNSGTSH